MSRETLKLIASRLDEIKRLCTKESRDPDPEERTEINGLMSQVQALEFGMEHTLEPRLTLEAGPIGDGTSRTNRNLVPFQLRGSGDNKSYRSLFGSNEVATWRDKDVGFFEAAWQPKFHPDLQLRAMSETTPSDGGYLVPSEYSSKIHAVSLENEVVMPRATVQPMKSNELHLPGLKIGDHSSNLYGGFQASYKGELMSLTEASPKTRDMILTAHKLTGLIRFSSELQADVVNFEDQIISLCGKGLSWYRDKAFLTASGAGEPLGVKNADCLISVSKEGGQSADTIEYANLTKMLSRLWPGSFNNAVWLASVSTIPQLLALTIEVGTAGGSHYPVLSESNGQWRLLTRPIKFTEHMSVLGDEFDIALVDFSQYVIGLRQEMRFDTSIHVHFQTDELLARLIERHDGQPLWSEALTLEDGSTTVSPFVTLAAR